MNWNYDTANIERNGTSKKMREYEKYNHELKMIYRKHIRFAFYINWSIEDKEKAILETELGLKFGTWKSDARFWNTAYVKLCLNVHALDAGSHCSHMNFLEYISIFQGIHSNEFLDPMRYVMLVVPRISFASMLLYYIVCVGLGLYFTPMLL